MILTACCAAAGVVTTLSCGVHSVSRRNGLWPCPGKVNASTDQYGGLPQANLTAHLPVHLAALAA